MKICDCEAYLPNSGNPYLCGDSFETADLIRMVDEVETEAVLTIPAPEAPLPGWEPTNNSTLKEAMDQYPGKILGCCIVDPGRGDEAVEEFRMTVEEWGFSGLKYSPGSEGTALALAQAAVDLQVPVTIHTNGSEATYAKIAELADMLPELVVVMEHMGYRFHVDLAIDVGRGHPNVYLAPTVTAAAEPMAVKRAVQELGARQMVFGSNAPWAAPRFGVQAIKRLELSAEEEQLIFRENFRKIYRLN